MFFDSTRIDQANRELKLGIALLRGEICVQDFDKALSDVLLLKDRLKDTGFIWQSSKLEIWLRKAQKEHGYLPRRGTPARKGEGGTHVL